MVAILAVTIGEGGGGSKDDDGDCVSEAGNLLSDCA